VEDWVVPEKIQYSIAVDFTNGFNKPLLRDEIEAEPTLAPIFIGIVEGKDVNDDNDSDGVQIWLKRALTAGEQTTLDNTVQAHNPTTTPIPPPDPGDQDGDFHAPTHYPGGFDAISWMTSAGATVNGELGWVKPPGAGTPNSYTLTAGMTWTKQSGSNAELVFPVVFDAHPIGGVPVASIDGVHGYRLNDGATNKGVSLSLKLTDSMNISQNPRVLFDAYQYTKAGVSTSDSVVFQANAKYLADGELTSGAVAETMSTIITWAVDPSDINNDGQKMTGVFVLNKSLIQGTDTIFVSINRIGNDVADTFTGQCLFGKHGAIEFGIP
jgi:hypothetical protein